MEEETYISIDRYLANEMEEEERVAFEERLKRDRNLSEKLTIYQSAAAALKAKFQREEREAMFKHNIAKIAAELPVAKEGKVVKLNWYAWAAAASVALLCLIIFYTTSSKPEYSKFAHYEPIALMERGQEDDGSKVQAQRAFNSREYKFAVVLFDKLLEHDTANAEIKLYKGIALLESNKISEANEMFIKVRESNSIFKDKATWMLALSALKQEDYKTCEAYLKKIPEGSAEYDDAQRLLDEL